METIPNNSQDIQNAAIARKKAAKRLELKCLALDGHVPSETDYAWKTTPLAKPRSKPVEGEYPDVLLNYRI